MHMLKSAKFRERYRAGRQCDDPISYFGSDAFKAYDDFTNGHMGPADQSMCHQHACCSWAVTVCHC